MKISEIVTEAKLEEVSKELKDRYVQQAVGAHGHYNMARRNTQGKDKEYWARKEKNTQKGISRALKHTEKDNFKDNSESFKGE
jgi:hypothetical protein